MSKQPVQFTPLDNIRKELDSKIEQRVYNHVFYWAMATLIMAFGGLLTYAVKTNNSQNLLHLEVAYLKNKDKITDANNKKLDAINTKLVRLETKFELLNDKEAMERRVGDKDV